MPLSSPQPHGIESPHAWMRLVVSVTLMTIGGAGIYGSAVILPAMQADFAIDRGQASLPYTLALMGFGFGGIFMGRLADRRGVAMVIVIGALALGLGFAVAALAGSFWLFLLAHGVLIGLLGASVSLAPLVADTSLWFDRRRGLALAICMCGNYLAGVVWPPLMQHFIDGYGWRPTYLGVGVACVLTMVPLALLLRGRAPRVEAGAAALPARPLPSARFVGHSDPARPLGLRPGTLQLMLFVAGIACCVAMSMPQVHIVAYCTDLGFGAARGAEMLSLMMAAGILSRLASGWISDRIGGLHTMLLGSLLQGVALLLFLPFDGLVSLYLISGLFGLFQGGIVPSYALVVREYFTPLEAGARMGTVLTGTLLGMALGGWLSGAIFDWTGSYRAAFVNGIGWNLLNLAIVGFLIYRARTGVPPRAAAPHEAVAA